MGSWVEDYVAAKLTDIEEALAELERHPDSPELREQRAQLVRLQAQLMIARTTFAPSEQANN